MKRKNVSITTIFIVFLIFAIVMSFITLYLLSNKNSNILFSSYNKVLENNLKEQLKKQDKVDEKIEELLNQSFSIEDPYILNDPYGISPLTSLIFFDTEEETTVDVYINDEFLTTVNKSKKHIIPIYGLYSNANNYVLLKTNNKEKLINIKTNVYNDEIEDNNLKFNEKERLMILSEDVDNNTLLRGFDKDNNLMYYLKFGIISNIIYHYDHFYIEYNNSKTLKPLKIEMDYLGRIFSISSNTIEFKNDNKVTTVNMYKDIIDNYKIPEVVDTEVYSKEEMIKTETIENILMDAELYKDEYEIEIENDYLIFNFKENVDKLLLVKKNSNYTYEYDIKDKNILKIDMNTDVSLYIKINDTYYCLLKTIKK